MPDETLANRSAAARPRRRWFQFSLRTLLIGMTLACVGCALLVAPKARHHAAIMAVQEAGAYIEYEPVPVEESWIRRRLRGSVPKDWLDDVVVINLSGRMRADDTLLAEVGRITTVRKLLLDGTAVTDAGLVNLKGLSALQTLSFPNKHGTDAGLAHISELASLQTLWLDRAEITDAGLAHLENLVNLQTLSLYGTRVSDAGVERLKRITSLKSVNLECRRVAPSAATASP